jgi:hypothetical protein
MLALVTISVFGLFHPVELEVRPAPGGVIVVKSGEDERELEGSRSMRLRSAAFVTGRDGAPVRFMLSVPGKIRRDFFGTGRGGAVLSDRGARTARRFRFLRHDTLPVSARAAGGRVGGATRTEGDRRSRVDLCRLAYRRAVFGQLRRTHAHSRRGRLATGIVSVFRGRMPGAGRCFRTSHRNVPDGCSGNGSARVDVSRDSQPLFSGGSD